MQEPTSTASGSFTGTFTGSHSGGGGGSTSRESTSTSTSTSNIGHGLDEEAITAIASHVLRKMELGAPCEDAVQAALQEWWRFATQVQ